ncbi:MAG: hypothetical protein WAV40_04655 [Microgenomates group bacterium]
MSFQLGPFSFGNPETERDGARTASEISSDEEMMAGCAITGMIGFAFICCVGTAITNPTLVRNLLYATGIIR